jgi:hypothetical protein
MATTPVCAWMNLGPFSHHIYRYDSIGEAKREFKERLSNFYGSLDGIIDRVGVDYAPCLDLYPQCDECQTHMNFHDYPMSRYKIGNRGGLRKVSV